MIAPSIPKRQFVDVTRSTAKGKSMRRTAVAILLFALSGLALADWSRLNTSDAEDMYADISTIQKADNTAVMWIMFDFKKPTIRFGAAPSLSVKFKDEFECRGDRIRTVAWVEVSGKTGEGNVVTSNATIGEWSPIVPNSTGATLLNIACSGQALPAQTQSGQVPFTAVDITTILNQMPTARWQLSGRSKWGDTPATDFVDLSPRLVNDKGRATLLVKVEFSSPIRRRS